MTVIIYNIIFADCIIIIIILVVFPFLKKTGVVQLLEYFCCKIFWFSRDNDKSAIIYNIILLSKVNNSYNNSMIILFILQYICTFISATYITTILLYI